MHDALDAESLTGVQHEALTQLCEALEVGRHDARGQPVLSLLGLNVPETVTSFRRSVLAHVFRHGEPPATDWCANGDELIVELVEAGLVDDDGASLELTDEGLSVAGVLVPRCTRITGGQWITTGTDALTVVTTARTDGSTAVVKLVEAGV